MTTSDLKITMAIKPKHPTRKAVDNVLDSRGDLLNIVTVNTAQQAVALMDTSRVALYIDGAYYPVDVDNVQEQIDLVAAGEDPTVEQDLEFGTPGIENFLGIPEDELPIQKNMEAYAGILRGDLIKVLEPNDTYDKRGYYAAITFDTDGASNAGYSEIKLNDENLESSKTIYFGENEEDVLKARFILTAKYTPVNSSAEEGEAAEGEDTAETEEAEAQDILEAIENRLRPLEIILSTNTKLGLPAISVDGKEYQTLQDAIAAISTSGTIRVAKALTLSNYVIIGGGKEITIELDNTTINLELKKYFYVYNGATLNIIGKGTVQELTPYFAPIMLVNTNEASSASVYIGEGVLCAGWSGVFFDKASYNLHAVVDGDLECRNDGSQDGFAFYANGNVKSGSAVLNGHLFGEGFGVYCPANVDVVVSGKVDATQSGVEVKGGSLTIKRTAVINTTCKEVSMTANNNGTVSTGCGVAVAYAVKDRKMDVVIEGGIISGGCAFMQGNPSNIDGALDHTSVKILDGTFASSGEETVKVLEEDGLKNFIYGGEYTHAPEEKFLAPGYEASMGNGRYVVAKKA